MLQTQHLLCSHFPICLSPPQTHFLFPPNLSSSRLNFLYKPISLCSVSAHSRPRPEQWLAEAPEPTTSIPTAPYTPLEFAPEGPEELPPSSSPVFATTDDPSSIQVATSVLLTGAISVFLFRSLRRRARRAKEMKFRSSGVKKSLKKEALDSLKTLSTGSVEEKGPPSPVQALLGGILAGVIALILYKFTTTIEASLNRQTISDNFSVRQITITIRTIINGLCYLATFVFGTLSRLILKAKERKLVAAGCAFIFGHCGETLYGYCMLNVQIFCTVALRKNNRKNQGIAGTSGKRCANLI